MNRSRVAVIVSSIQDAHVWAAAGATDIVFAVSMVPRAANLTGERLCGKERSELINGATGVIKCGGRAHIQIRDLAMESRLIGEAVRLIADLCSQGFIECWAGDTGLIQTLHQRLPAVPIRADWRLPLSNTYACKLAVQIGASKVCIAPPVFDVPEALDPAVLVLQGAPVLDPRFDLTCELLTAPFVLSELEWQSFSYPLPHADMTSASNRAIKELEGEWRRFVCPLGSLDLTFKHWRSWGCAACARPRPWLPVVEYPPVCEPHLLALVSSKEPAGVANTLARPELCRTSARCRS